MIDLVDKIESVLTLNANDYLGDLIGGGLLIAESRTVAATLLQHLPEADWKRLFEVENVLQKPSRHSSIRYARAIRRRLAPLGRILFAPCCKRQAKNTCKCCCLPS
nr:BrxA family protein [Thiothrix subterranea]